VARRLLTPDRMTNDRSRKTSLGWAAQPPPEPDGAPQAWPPSTFEPQTELWSAPPPSSSPPYASPPGAPPPWPSQAELQAQWSSQSEPQAQWSSQPPPYAAPPPPSAYPVAPRPPGDPLPAHLTQPRSNPAPPPARKPSSPSAARVRFIRLTYLHLLLAIAAFAGLLRLLITQPALAAHVSAPLVKFALGGRWNWGVVLAAFMAVSWVADRWASNASSRAVQYAGLAFYTLAEALIFVPLLAIVEWKTQAILARGGAEPHIVRDAAFVTLGIFGALTLSVFLSRKDFSFLRSGLVMASGAALSLIAMSLVFGFNLGLAFSVAMVLLAAGYVLYQTSQILAHYDPRHHVAAALALFSSVALMFWYVIRIFLRARD
jgi:FtsH-binding integral membrane protein